MRTKKLIINVEYRLPNCTGYVPDVSILSIGAKVSVKNAIFCRKKYSTSSQTIGKKNKRLIISFFILRSELKKYVREPRFFPESKENSLEFKMFIG